MRKDFQENFEFQAPFAPMIKQIVGPHLLVPAPTEIDMREATDMLMLTARDLRIGCRIRRWEYAERFPWDFTIRSRVPSGATTELGKIADGWGDWLFYGYASPDGSFCIPRWFIVDLAHFRSHLIWKTAPESQKQINGDGTRFCAWDLRRFPPHPPICVASSHEITRLEIAA